MRTIKFRGKRIDNGEWVYGIILPSEKDYLILELIGYHNNTPQIIPVRVIPETVGQFTGLFDSTGAEIYEGDIDKSYGEISIGVYELGKGFGVQTWVFKNNTVICDHEGKTNYIIIGNIHDKTSDQ